MQEAAHTRRQPALVGMLDVWCFDRAAVSLLLYFLLYHFSYICNQSTSLLEWQVEFACVAAGETVYSSSCLEAVAAPSSSMTELQDCGVTVIA
mmetsp:Transcript_32653/g.65024  ORF Transcript_32653/g.65024 Transcript_32653/m.65024 type:complete len:93 (-) Transcript_32653:172-450(-)